jgi:hypothetical protein
MRRSLQSDRSAQRNAEQDHSLLGQILQPLQDAAQIIYLLLQGDAFGILPRRDTTAALFPITHQ